MSEVAELFAREFPVWHMVVRGTVVYWFLLLVFLMRRQPPAAVPAPEPVPVAR